jgi:transposase InsO family protein
MSVPGQPTQNARAESFFKTLKYEEVYVHHYQTLEEAQAHLQTFLEDVYNAKRLHSSLEYVPPDEFEADYLKCSCSGGMDFLGAFQGFYCQNDCQTGFLREWGKG